MSTSDNGVVTVVTVTEAHLVLVGWIRIGIVRSLDVSPRAGCNLPPSSSEAFLGDAGVAVELHFQTVGATDDLVRLGGATLLYHLSVVTVQH